MTDKKMTPEEALATLSILVEEHDTEQAHAKADDVLCALLRYYDQHEVVETYLKIGRWFA